jgi:hypothetical protein
MFTNPELTPVTTPVGLTEAIVGFELIHVPPVSESDNVIVEPVQTVVGPVIVPAVGPVMLTFFVEEPTPHAPETV